MTWIAYTYIHVCVYTGHILEVEDTCAIFNWNAQKNGVKEEVITKSDTKRFFKIFLTAEIANIACVVIIIE